MYTSFPLPKRSLFISLVCMKHMRLSAVYRIIILVRTRNVYTIISEPRNACSTEVSKQRCELKK